MISNKTCYRYCTIKVVCITFHLDWWNWGVVRNIGGPNKVTNGWQYRRFPTHLNERKVVLGCHSSQPMTVSRIANLSLLL
jgi:hypothetical protein